MANSERVLVVEDEEIVRTLLERMLTDLGYEVRPASNGKEALEVIQGDGPFALLLTDMVLPGMSGLELAAEVAALADRKSVV